MVAESLAASGREPHGRTVLETGGRIDDHRLTRADAGEHLARFAARCAECHRTALRLAILHHEHDVLVTVLAQGAARHQHRRPRARWLCFARFRRCLLEERHAHAHVRHDTIVLDIEADAYLARYA